MQNYQTGKRGFSVVKLFGAGKENKKGGFRTLIHATFIRG